MPDMKSVTIAGKQFTLSVPYAEGHTLTAGEASQLNQVRHENIRNNLAKFIRENTTLSDEELQAKVAETDAAYVMGVRQAAGPGASRDPIAVEARSIARTAIKAKLKAANITKTNEEIAEAIEKLLASPAGENIRNMAAQRVEEKQRIGDSIMADIAV